MRRKVADSRLRRLKPIRHGANANRGIDGAGAAGDVGRGGAACGGAVLVSIADLLPGTAEPTQSTNTTPIPSNQSGCQPPPAPPPPAL
ncbi:unnamed protein product, partial [Iphiclides podalirius]